MRLLNVDTLEFGEFFDADIPPYTILSHRWGAEEVSHKDFKKGRMKESGGYKKILGCCALTRKQRDAGIYRRPYLDPTGLLHNEPMHVGWTWIDTCCIDKRSSAEMSEAINSMYRWYANAQECFVYLSDVSWRDHMRGTHLRALLHFSKW